MSPNNFWKSSPQEIYMAIDGFLEFNGGKKEEPMTKDRLNEMMEFINLFNRIYRSNIKVKNLSESTFFQVILNKIDIFYQNRQLHEL